MEDALGLTLLTRAGILEDLEIERKGTKKKLISAAAGVFGVFLLAAFVRWKDTGFLLFLLVYCMILAVAFCFANSVNKKHYRKAAAAIETGSFAIAKKRLNGYVQKAMGGDQLKGKTAFYCITSRVPEDRGLGFIAVYPVDYYRLDSDLTAKQLQPEPQQPISGGAAGKLMNKFVSCYIEPVTDADVEAEDAEDTE